jgi:broad specificity phosphatase PhoE
VSTTRIVLCRHGETEASARGRFCGALDVGLSPVGRKEAALLAAGAGVASALYASPARRALETARPIGERVGLEPIIEPRIRELDFGEVDGVPYEQVAALRPELYDEWLRAPTRVRFPGGECYADLRGRAVEAVSEVISRHEGETVLIVTHAGVIRALLAVWLLLADEAVFRIDQRYGSVNVVDWLDGTPVVRLLNGQPGSTA